jgi:two-component system sensor histidine kinase EvgS
MCRAALAPALLCAALACQAAHDALPLPPAGPVALPADAQTWLRAHPIIRVGVGPEWPPIDQFAADGQYAGLSGMLLHVVAEKLEARIQIVRFARFDLALAAARRGEIDLLSSMARTPEREAALAFSRPYVNLPAVYVGRYDVTDFSAAGNFGGRSLVVERGFVTEEYLRRRFPNARILLRDNTRQALEAVATREADFYLGSLLPAHYVVEQALLPNLAVLGTAPAHLNFGALHFAAPKSAQPVIAAIDASLEALGPDYLNQLRAAWSPRYAQLRPLAAALQLSNREQRLLDRLPELRVGVLADHAPLSTRSASGEPEGLGVAIFEAIARPLGLRWRYLELAHSDQAARAVTSGELDIAIGLPARPDLAGHAAFVGPIHSTTTVLVSRVDAPDTELSGLAGRKLAVVSGEDFAQTLLRDWPAIRLRQFETTGQALAAVRDRAADAAAVEIELAQRLLSLRYPGQLHVSAVVPDSAMQYHVAVAAGRTDLALLLRRSLDALSEADRDALRARWLRVEVGAGVPWRRIAAVGGPLLLALLAILFTIAVANRRLRAEVARRRAAEEELRHARDLALADATAKSDFLASMAHELRTPMTGIQGLAGLLGREATSMLARSRTDLLQRLVKTLNQLLTQVLDFSRMRAHEVVIRPQPLDLVRLLRETVAEYSAGAELKGLVISTHIGTAPGDSVSTDPLRLRQIVGNLLTNAIKFTERGGVTVSLVTEALDTGRVRCRIGVADTGIGIDPALRALLTERYVQAPDSAHRFGGTGLGLAIVRELTEKMGGHLDIESIAGGGSRFTGVLDFALAPREAAAAVGTAPALPEMPRVLLVEDDAVSRLVLEQMLRSCASTLTAVASVTEALEQLRLNEFDVLVTDLNLGEHSGIDLAASARALRPQLRIVLCSASSADQLLRPQAAGVVDAVVAKPVDMDGLVAAVTGERQATAAQPR